MGARELNLGPHDFKINPVPIEPPPQLQPFLQWIHACKESSSWRGCLPPLLYFFLFCCYAEVHTLQGVTWGSVLSLSSPPCLSFMSSFCFVILATCFLTTVFCSVGVWPMESGSNVTSAAHKAPIRWLGKFNLCPFACTMRLKWLALVYLTSLSS